jgi:hypothetical protein
MVGQTVECGDRVMMADAASINAMLPAVFTYYGLQPTAI